MINHTENQNKINDRKQMILKTNFEEENLIRFETFKTN